HKACYPSDSADGYQAAMSARPSVRAFVKDGFRSWTLWAALELGIEYDIALLHLVRANVGFGILIAHWTGVPREIQGAVDQGEAALIETRSAAEVIVAGVDGRAVAQ